MRRILIIILVLLSASCTADRYYASNVHINIQKGLIIDTSAMEGAVCTLYGDSIVFMNRKNMYSYIINGKKPVFHYIDSMNNEQYDFIFDNEYRQTIINEMERCHSFYGHYSRIIIVSVYYQRMIIADSTGNIINVYPVSTSKYGIGNENGSNKTPLGAHVIAYKTGDNAHIGAIFRFLKDTGEIAEIYSDTTDTDSDYVTTRILRIMGAEEGVNKGGNVDSFNRHIYIHGTHEEGRIHIPSSHGCIRMLNHDVIELYNNTAINTPIIII